MRCMVADPFSLLIAPPEVLRDLSARYAGWRLINRKLWVLASLLHEGATTPPVADGHVDRVNASEVLPAWLKMIDELSEQSNHFTLV